MRERTRGRARPRRMAASCALLFLTLSMGLASAAPSSPTTASCPGVKTSGQWSRISLPAWPRSAPDDVNHTERSVVGSSWDGDRHVAVDSVDPHRLYATDGHVLVRSTDGGCSWRQIFSLYVSGLPRDAANDPYPWLYPGYKIYAIAPGGGSHHVIYLFLGVSGFGSLPTGTDPAFVAASEDDGQTWLAHRIDDADVPAAQVQASTWGAGGELVTAPSAPQTVYYRSSYYGDYNHDGASHQTTLLVSHDAGRSWHVQGTLPGLLGFPGWHDAFDLVDPVNPNVLWRDTNVRGGRPELRVYRSANGGSSYGAPLLEAPSGAQLFGWPFLSLRPDGGSVCAAAHSPAALRVSTSSGQRWTALPLPPALDKDSGPALIEGAACLDGGWVIAVAGYQPGQYLAPPFRRSELWVHRPGSSWRRLGAVPSRLGVGSLNVVGAGGRTTAFWFGADESGDPRGQVLDQTHLVWLRYNGPLK